MSGLRFPGLVERIQARMRAQGYAMGERILWGRWATDKGYGVNVVQNWMRGATPTYDYLVRLARDLECDLGWLLLGPAPDRPDGPDRRRRPRRPVPIAGGSAGAQPLPVRRRLTGLPLIRRWRDALRRWATGPTSNGWSWAPA